MKMRAYEKELQKLSVAAERAAGRIRAMEPEEFEEMMVWLNHAADSIETVVRKATGQGQEDRLIRRLAMGDLEALRKVLWVLGREDDPEHMAH